MDTVSWGRVASGRTSPYLGIKNVHQIVACQAVAIDVRLDPEPQSLRARGDRGPSLE